MIIPPDPKKEPVSAASGEPRLTPLTTSRSDQESVPPPVKRRKKWKGLRWALELGVVAVIFFGIRAWQQQDAVSGQAPALSGVLVDGAPFALAAASGHPTLVHFWATWCAVCRAEQGNIQSVAQSHAVITVAMQSGPADAVARHLAAEGLDFRAMNDLDGTVSRRWGVRAVPTSFVVDGQGKVRFVEVGYTTTLGLRLRLWWAGIT